MRVFMCERCWWVVVSATRARMCARASSVHLPMVACPLPRILTLVCLFLCHSILQPHLSTLGLVGPSQQQFWSLFEVFLYPPEFGIPKEPLKLEKRYKKPQNGRTPNRNFFPTRTSVLGTPPNFIVRNSILNSTLKPPPPGGILWVDPKSRTGRKRTPPQEQPPILMLGSLGFLV